MIESSGFNQAWEEHHGFLLDVAYRLLGSYTDAEDIVQEAFTRLLRSDLDPIEDARAWLVVVVSRLCLDYLRSARVRREAYVGPWFPEPLVALDGDSSDPANVVTLDESVRMAMLVVLERMSPAERVVFVLHDVFEYPFETIAKMVGRSAAACRQLATRARKRVREETGSGRFRLDRDEHERVVRAFIAACASGDVKALLRLLDRSVAGWADIGGVLSNIKQPNVGREKVGGNVMQFFGAATGRTMEMRSINGEPGIVVYDVDGELVAVIALTLNAGAITRVYVVADPRKLEHARRGLVDSR